MIIIQSFVFILDNNLPILIQCYLFPPLFIIRDLEGNEGPEFWTVVHLGQVTKFMDDNIVCEWKWQENEFVIEIEYFLARATSPSGFLITNDDFGYFKFIKFIKMRNSFVYQNIGSFFVLFIIFYRIMRQDFLRARLCFCLHFDNPIFFAFDKTLGEIFRQSPRHCNQNFPIRLNSYPYAF